MVTAISEGSLTADMVSYPPGTTLTYTCNEAFTFTGNLNTVCDNNFMWSLDQNPPACSRGKNRHSANDVSKLHYV